MRERDNIRRIVLKVGTNTLCNPDGKPDELLLRDLARQVHLLRSQGKQVLIISSGAIGCGQSVLQLPERPQDIAKRQALAALGQHRLMAAWQDAFQRHKVQVGQVLVTHHTFNKRRSYLNLRHCLETLLDLGAVPILNENDAVSVAEIDATFGDNDHLGALVAAKVEADLYAVLSDVDGLYDKPPHLRGAKRLDEVDAITDEVLAMAGDKAGRNATGGMRSKLESARQLTESGIAVVIAYGRGEDVLLKLLDPESEEAIGTWIHPVGHRDGVERWLVAAHPKGAIEIDAGAVEALAEGFNLLPAGITGVDGEFPVETVIDITHGGKAIARAVSHLSSGDLERCKGMQSDDAKQTLGMDAPVNVTKKGRITMLD